MEFIISETDDILVSHAGLALAGALLQRTDLRRRLDTLAVEGLTRPVMPHGEVLLSMIGLLCLGKSDYAAIEPFRRESFFARALGLSRLPSEETLRQRMDQLGTVPLAILHEETAGLLHANAPALAPCHRGRVPLDVDVSPWDNSGTKKEGVACTYKLCEGYAPIFAYLGLEGYLIHSELRPGDQHCQRGTPAFLDPAIALARKVTDAKLLVDTSKAGQTGQKLAVIPAPTAFNRFVNIPMEKGTYIAPLEEVILDNAQTLFGPREIRGHALFRITRDADVAVQNDEAADLLSAVQEAVISRRRRSAVRLEISARPDSYIVRWLASMLLLKAEDIYEIDGLLDARSLMQIMEMQPLQGLRVPEWTPQTPRDLLGEEELWPALQDHDVLLFHPYEKFDPVIQMVARAADDPQVLAIKQTLYRPTADSPIVQSLARAAENGKEVTVLVELQARFDEAKNVQWARRLEDAGCHVIYGIAGFKTHARALWVVRREAGRIRRHVHLPTGNYNEKTAKQYSDLGLMTCDEELAADVAAFFNLLTGLSEAVEWQQLVIAPTDLRQRFVDLIEREIQVSTPERPGLIMAKLSALEDKGMCQALYRASQAGVKILLNVRGICCLRPGVKGLSETIHVRSIVDRFLEHARIYYFANGGHEEIYLGSADWMKRNLDHRFEILFPIRAPALRQRLLRILDMYFTDNVKARELLPNGKYRVVPRNDTPIRAQERLYEEAVAAVQAAERTAYRFRPLTRTRSDGIAAVS